MTISIPEMVIGAIVEMGVEGIWETAKRRETILRLLKKLGYSLDHPPSDFDGLYAYALVEYGVGKPRQILELFRYEIIREAFRRTFEQRDRADFDDEIEAFLDSEMGQETYQLDYDPKQELARFQAVFDKLADRARTVPEVRQDHKLEDIHQAVQQVLASLGGLSTQKPSEVEQNKTNQAIQGAALALRLVIRGKPQPALKNRWAKLRLDVAVTSTNAISSEDGALKLTLAYPIAFSRTTKIVFRPAHFESTGLRLKDYDEVPHAQSLMMRWGSSRGTVIFPGDWHNFYGNPISIDIPDPSHLPKPTYLLQAELFTVNSPTTKILYSIQQNPDGSFGISEVNIDAANYGGLTSSFWATYHAARKMLSG